MVAQYANACNLFDSPEIAHKLDVLRGHCDAQGRDYDEIEKTVISVLDVGSENGEKVDDVLAHLAELAALGITHVHTGIRDCSSTSELEILGERVIPEAAKL